VRGDVMFELHRNIVQAYRTRMNLDDIWRRATLDPSGMHRLESIDQFLLAVLHIARHELAVHAINYLDIHRLWTRLDSRARETAHTRARAWRITRSLETVLATTALLARGERGAPGPRFLPSTDDILLGTKPPRGRQIAQKLWLTEGTRERLGLGFAWAGAIVEGWWRTHGEGKGAA
ncbi:MAG: nucleotidyltransferase family protein, partial [Myxococcales bacterium]|nr:nucleotidyltransferase family protein [Myxococcales bacterium]